MRTNFVPTLFTSLCILLCATFSSNAQTVWTDATGNWFTAGNWSAGVPTAGTAAEVNNGGTAQIGGGAAAASSLTLGSGVLTGNVSVNGGSALMVGNTIDISGATSVFSINAGSVVTSSFGTMSQGGTATINGGSTWSMSQTLLIGNGNGTATFNENGGSAVSAADVSLGISLNSTATGTIDGGSSLAMTGELHVGTDGTATLNIQGGSGVIDPIGVIGYDNTAHGTVNVSGAASWNNSGSLTVGKSGTGTLTITSGTVTSHLATIGENAGSTGIVNVNGATSVWNNPDLGIAVGFSGNGTLNVTAGGKVTNAGNAPVGYQATAVGIVNVSGTGSTWSNGGNLGIGDFGKGTMNITAGGMVTNVDGSLGSGGVGSGAIGTATVDGTNSKWINSGVLVVGGNDTGMLTISNGGAVSDNSAQIAAVTGSHGTVIVDGTASTWTTTTAITVGGVGVVVGGTGLLRIQNGGTVTDGDEIRVNSSGTLEIGASYTLNSSGVAFDGGTLRTIANTTFDHATLFNTGMIVDSDGFTSTITGSLNGPGGLTKIGAGTIILANTNIYSGTTTVNAGSLLVDGSIASPNTDVNSGGLLGGVGTIFGNVVNAGIVSPGDSPGTLTINQNYAQLSTGVLRIEVAGLAAAQHDLLAVGGSASLNGTLQVLRLNNFLPTIGDRVTIITDAGGHTRTFTTVTGDFNGVLRPVPQYDEANDVYLLFQLFSFNVGGLTPNQKSVARNLDVAANDLAAAPLINFLALEALGNLPHDYDLIAPEELASIYEIGFSQAVVQNNNLQRRMDDIRAGSNGFCANGFTPQVSGKDYTKESDGKVSLPDKNTHDIYTPSADNRWGVFVTGSGDFVTVSNDDLNARGYDITTGNFTVGADYRLCDHFAIGIDAGYSRSTADLVDNGRVDVDGGKIGAYATVFGKGLFGSKFYVDGGVGGGLNSYDTRRTGLQDVFVRGDTDGTEFNAMISYGSDWTFGCFNVGTWSTVQYTNVSIDQFTETGSLAPLEIQDQDENSFRATTGVHASYDIKAGHFLFRPEVRVAYQHEYCDSAYQVDSRLASGAGDIFRVRGPNIGRDAALVGAGMSMQWNNRLSTYVYYDGVLGRNNYDNNAISGGFRIGF
jgi:outer membrane autotransporter protein